MIYMIYAPVERPLAEAFAAKIAPDQEVRYAPFGWEAGSENWLEVVKTDLHEADLALLLITPRAVRDESIAETLLQRYVIAQDANVRLIPLSVNITTELTSLEVNEGIGENGRKLLRRAVMAYQLVGPNISTTEDPVTHEIVIDIPDATLERLQNAIKDAMKGSLRCFISYAHDDSDFAIKLGADLRNAHVKTWRDAENIPAGSNWDREVEKALLRSSHVLLVATSRSVASENVMDELSVAMNHHKVVIPLIVETCDLPMRVHRAQWVDFRGDYAAGLKALLAQLGIK